MRNGNGLDRGLGSRRRPVSRRLTTPVSEIFYRSMPVRRRRAIAGSAAVMIAVAALVNSFALSGASGTPSHRHPRGHPGHHTTTTSSAPTSTVRPTTTTGPPTAKAPATTSTTAVARTPTTSTDPATTTTTAAAATTTTAPGRTTTAGSPP